MSLKALSEYTFTSRYAHYDPKKKKRESWEDAVAGVFDMHRKKYAEQIEKSSELAQLIDFAQSMQRKKRVLAAQRSLQFKGDPIFKHELKMFNCLFTHIDRPRVFQETMYSLLCGCGVGFSVQEQHVYNLPVIHSVGLKEREYVVEDSIEGWSDAIGVLITSYFQSDNHFTEYTNHPIKFNFDKIRPEGSLIAGKFKAPGSAGLARSLNKIQSVIEARLASGTFHSGKFAGRLRPIDCYDIIMHISDAVLSGGVRRSATICLFTHSDQEMLNAKIGNWYAENPQRARSNNSAALLRGAVSREEFANIIKSTKEFGEPGFVWVSDLDIGVNPCVTGDTIVRIKDAESEQERDISMIDLVSLVNQDPDKMLLILSQNIQSGKNEWKPVTAAALTRKNSDIISVELDDGKILKCTPDHQIYTKNRGYIEAKDLTEDDDIVTLTRV